MFSRVTCLFLVLITLLASGRQQVMAQFNDGMGGPPKNLFDQNSDSSRADSMSHGWKDEQARIFYTGQNSSVRHIPDTSIGRLHRFQHSQPWWGNHLGNYGTAALSLLFQPERATGMRLGYSVYDLYKIKFDSLRFYNTTRPYSAFSFMLGSKEQQNVEILHTQNIKPNWNFAGRLRYLSSEGFYPLQKANSVSGSFNTHYESDNKKYQVKAALIYNRFKQDENGGILSDSLLRLPNYADRRRIPVNIPSLSGGNKSAVNNTWQDMDFYIQNNYSWGKADTLYNEDSTRASYQFTPRFRLQHELRIHNEKHIYRDLDPDSSRYLDVRPINFAYGDSIFGKQSWTYVDNKFSLNGFIGKNEQLAQIKAGVANRIDQFNQSYLADKDKNTYVSNYLFGTIKKEALSEAQWSYHADASFFFSGKALGNFEIEGNIAKNIGKLGLLSIGLFQNLSNPPFTTEQFKTNFYSLVQSFDKTSVTQLWAGIINEQYNFQITANNFLMANYIYLREGSRFSQSQEPFYITQISGRKQFKYRSLSIDNEIVWQGWTAGSPVSLPAFMVREQLKLETFVFRKALKVATGIEARYLSSYFINGYNYYLNQFYSQSTYRSSSLPELSVFFNFKVRNFRAFVLGDQIQQLISNNNINALAWYPQQNATFRFGFTWVLIN